MKPPEWDAFERIIDEDALIHVDNSYQETYELE